MTSVPNKTFIDREKLAALRVQEEAVFASRTAASKALRERAGAHLPNGVPMTWMSGLYRFPPVFAESGAGSVFRDVDGNSYIDFNVSDLSMTMGFGPAPIVEAVTRQVKNGAHFLLPTRDAVIVGERLSEQVGLPFWQFTLSASGANTEVLRIARFMTGRSKIVIFSGHYHGHIDETLVQDEGGGTLPSLHGLPADVAARTMILPFNDLDAVEKTLAAQDVALVLTEPMLTNCNLVLPAPGFLEGLRAATRRHGTLLCLDEAHTFQFAYGGLTGAWKLETDFVVLGKGLGTGISFGLYGMSAEVAAVFTRHSDVDIGPKGIATGGTTYGSAIAVAAARAALDHVLSPEAYERLGALGARLSDGLETLFKAHHLPWRAFRFGPRSGYCLTPHLPANGEEAAASLDVAFIDARRLFMANRGIWDAVASAGPQASFAHTEKDIDAYLGTADQFLKKIIINQNLK